MRNAYNVDQQENSVIITESAVRYKIRELLSEGIYHQDELFNIVYPAYKGHYSVLRDIISEEKNYA